MTDKRPVIYRYVYIYTQQQQEFKQACAVVLAILEYILYRTRNSISTSEGLVFACLVMPLDTRYYTVLGSYTYVHQAREAASLYRRRMFSY